jgi:heme O synthase-like polyprenyltransferase
MATEPIPASLDTRLAQRHTMARSTSFSDYMALTKPEINFLIVIATMVDFWMGSPEVFPHLRWLLLLNAVPGTVLVASGAATLNQLMEMRFDS